MNKLAAKIKEMRIEKGLNCSQLAKEVGVGVASICNIESGRRKEIKYG